MTQQAGAWISNEQLNQLLSKLPGQIGAGAPKPTVKAFGMGSCDCTNPTLGPLAAGVYAMLAAGSPRLALAKAKGVPLAPYIINVRAIFPDTATSVVTGVGSDVKIVQDTLIDALVVRVQNESTTANQNQFQAFSDFFFGFQSGIEAKLSIQGAPRYDVANKYTPLSTLGDVVTGSSHWPGGWVLTYQQQLVMDFNAKILLPFAPIEVICTYRGWVPVTQAFVTMTTREAIDSLQNDFGIELDKKYIEMVLAL
jgi:hypothetical protein